MRLLVHHNISYCETYVLINKFEGFSNYHFSLLSRPIELFHFLIII